MNDFDYTTVPTGYYDQVFHRGSGVQSKWHHLKFEFFRERIRSGEHHLDVGCGPGTFIGTLHPDIKSLGVDVAPAQLDFARTAYGNANKRFGLMKQSRLLDCHDETFDVATCIELIEHLGVEANLELLREVRRVLKPGGRLLISTPNYSSLWPLLEACVNRLSPVSYEDQHITHFNRRRLAELLRQAGYQRVDAFAYQFMAPFAAVLNWNLADQLQRLEPTVLTRRLGFSLYAEAWK